MLDKYDDDTRSALLTYINGLCNALDVDPWELDCFNKHECERWD